MTILGWSGARSMLFYFQNGSCLSNSALTATPIFFSLTRFVSENKGGTEISQLFKYTPLFQLFIILDLYLRHMESLNEVVSRQAISAPPITRPPSHFFSYFLFNTIVIISLWCGLAFITILFPSSLISPLPGTHLKIIPRNA